MAAVGALLMTSGFLVMATAGTVNADQGGQSNNGNGNNGNGNGGAVHKVFVCKYVGTPGVDERLQTGNNPISVDTHALEKEGFTAQHPSAAQFPFEFEDAQGKSMAIAWDERQGDGQQDEPAVTIDDCPAPRTPQPTVVTPSLELNQKLCPPQDSIGWRGLVDGKKDSSTDNVDFALTGGSVAPGQTITVTATASNGVIFPDGGSTMLLTGKFDPAPTDCGGGGSQNQLTAPSVTFAEPTCENPNGAQIQLGNQDKVSYGVVGAAGPGEGVTVKATPKAGFAFAAGAQSEFSHTFKTIESLNCPSEQPTIVPSEEPTVGGTETTRPRPDNKPKPKPNEERPPVVLGTQAVPSAVAAGLPGAPTSGSGSSTMLVAQLMVGTGLVLLIGGGWTGMGARRSRSGAHQV